jgi:hypothetical protein
MISRKMVFLCLVAVGLFFLISGCCTEIKKDMMSTASIGFPEKLKIEKADHNQYKITMSMLGGRDYTIYYSPGPGDTCYVSCPSMEFRQVEAAPMK